MEVPKGREEIVIILAKGKANVDLVTYLAIEITSTFVATAVREMAKEREMNSATLSQRTDFRRIYVHTRTHTQTHTHIYTAVNIDTKTIECWNIEFIKLKERRIPHIILNRLVTKLILCGR